MNTRSSVGQGVHANACTSNSSSACTRADDTGCSGPFREEGILLRFTPLRSGAHWTFAPPIGGCSQASAHVARHDGAAGRRKTARRQEVVGSDVERSATGVTRHVAPRQVRCGLVAKARAGATPKRAQRVRGAACRETRSERRRRSAWLSWRRGIPLRRNAYRATAPARERLRSSVGRARAS
jgi:hypothetical protein